MGKLKSSFVLKKYKGNEKLVELYLSFGYREYDSIRDKYSYKPLRYYTGVKVKLSDWDEVNKVPVNQKKLNELREIEQTAHDIFNYLNKNSEVTPELFRKELDAKLKNKEVSSNEVVKISDYITNVILIEKTAGRSDKTLKQYRRLANKIEAFEKNAKTRITTGTLNESLYLEFIKHSKKSLTRMNSVWGLNKTFKSVLNEIARKYKINVFNPTHELAKADKISATNEEKIYLDFNHIKTILDYQPETESLRNTKLILTTLLFTGCRYSDVFKIKPDYEYNKAGVKFRYARFVDQKTGSDIIVPFLKPLEDAIKANGDKLPYKISDVKFNAYVKDLVELAELDEEITLSYTNAHGKKEYEVKQFFQFVTSHIGRRSFITNLINYVPVTILSKITGHSLTNNNVIFSYNKISLLDNAALFVKELKRVAKSNPKEFPIRLV